ncbi:MAG: biopolymer transporter ExbD [Chitinophagaceae bacterium]|nr:biopolymer transporter ExbD [Chitinophagaceae bacterium]
MAEIETKRATVKKQRFNKKSTRIDLTPMVDLGFLLITFFVFTTALTTPMAMNIVVPYDKRPVNDDVCESCVLTVLLHNNNRIVYYEGDLKNDPPVKETGFAAGEIRNVLMQKESW